MPDLTTPGRATPDLIELAPRLPRACLMETLKPGPPSFPADRPTQKAVAVTLPPGLSQEQAVKFLKLQSRWITHRLASLEQAPAFRPGHTLPLEGKPHTIVHHPTGRGGVWIETDQIFVSGAEEFISRRLTDFLKNRARLILGQELRAQAQTSGLHPTRLDIRDTSSRWGSCSSTGRIMLSWRLIMAPAPIRHYLIAHELAHLRHMNHSPAFWTLVNQLTPYRRHAEAWLKQHGSTLLGAR